MQRSRSVAQIRSLTRFCGQSRPMAPISRLSSGKSSAASKSAREAVEKAGGTVEVTAPAKTEATEA